MIGIVNKFRKIYRPTKAGKSGQTQGPSDLRLDQKLTFSPESGEKWTFEEDGRVHINDVDIEEMLDSERDDVQFLCGSSRGLHDYQLYVWSNGGKGRAEFNAKVRSLQDKIHLRLGDIYDNLTGGIDFEMCDGDFWMNNINVRKAIKLYYMRPTEKARRYLSGLKDKLALLLTQQRSSKRYDEIFKEASGLFEDLNHALEYIPADAPPRLVGRRRDA